MKTEKIIKSRKLKNGSIKKYVKQMTESDRKIYNDYHNDYREQNREKSREYMRAYMRRYRELKKQRKELENITSD